MVQFALFFSLLLSQADAPVAKEITPDKASEPVDFAYHYAAGSAVAILAVPASLYLGQELAGLSNDIYLGAALPVLLSIGLIPPVLITAVTVLVGNSGGGARYRWWPTLLATLVINGASLAIAAPLGLATLSFGKVVVYTLAQAVLQPGAAVLLQRAWPKNDPVVLSTPSDPVTSRTFVVPTGSWRF
ncbi:MAG: hypothetical protein JNK82_25005 [Myxococcaceae bacterium]|nr:hypothetical protein [Myxococcaceae bacterium]